MEGRGAWVIRPALDPGHHNSGFQEVVLERYETIVPGFEFAVGVMLVLLGVQVYWNLRRDRLHLHQHSHDSGPHVHIHATHDESADPEVERPHGFMRAGKPFFG